MLDSENEWQKIEQVPIPLRRAFRNFPNVKTRNEKKSIIGLWRYFHLSILGSRWTGTIKKFEMSKFLFFIVIQLLYKMS